jgi:hypothetical protein
MYQVVVALAVVVHVAFLCYVVVGGFVALRWRRTIWLHVPVVLWGIALTTENLDCPLTGLERWGRAKAGMAPLPSEGGLHRPLHHRRALPRQLDRLSAGCGVRAGGGVMGAVCVALLASHPSDASSRSTD